MLMSSLKDQQILHLNSIFNQMKKKVSITEIICFNRRKNLQYIFTRIDFIISSHIFNCLNFLLYVLLQFWQIFQKTLSWKTSRPSILHYYINWRHLSLHCDHLQCIATESSLVTHPFFSHFIKSYVI